MEGVPNFALNSNCVFSVSPLIYKSLPLLCVFFSETWMHVELHSTGRCMTSLRQTAEHYMWIRNYRIILPDRRQELKTGQRGYSGCHMPVSVGIAERGEAVDVLHERHCVQIQRDADDYVSLYLVLLAERPELGAHFGWVEA